MEYNDVVKKLNELIEKIKIAEEKADKEPEIEIEDENMDYTEQFLKTEEITKANANTPEKLKEEFDKTVEDSLKKFETEKDKLEKEIEDKLTNTEDYNSMYLVGELQAKVSKLDGQINTIKEISDKENEREEFGKIKKEIIDEELAKLEVRKQELEKEIESKTDGNDYMSQYMLGNLQAELNEINSQIETLKSGNFTRQQIDRAIVEIDKLKQEKSQLEDKINSIDENDANGIYLSGEQHNQLDKVNAKLKRLSVFNADIEKRKEKEQTKKQQTKPTAKTEPTPVNPKAIISNLKIVYNRETNKYELTDDAIQYKQEFELNKDLLKIKNISKIVLMAVEKRGQYFKSEISTMIDANLYNCLVEYDKVAGTNRAGEYIESLDGNGKSNLDVTYNLKGKRTLGIINNFRQNRMAKRSEEFIGAKVERNENAITKAIKDLFKRVKTKSLPSPEQQPVHDNGIRDINEQEIPSKDINEKEAFSSRIKVNQYSKPEIASYVNAYMTRGEQTEEKDINATNKAEYLQQLREEGLSEREITEISEKIEMQEGKNNQSREMNR